MREYLENALKQKVDIEENKAIFEKLPLVYRGRYDIFEVETNGIAWLAMKPKLELGLVILRKDWARIEKVSGLNCAIFLEKTSFYIKEKMIDEGIPFVLRGKYIFLPFMGYLLCQGKGRELKPVHLISFLTQKMILIAIYERWKGVKAADAARRLEVSRVSIGRCFDEIESLGIDILEMSGKARAITVPDEVRDFWKRIEHTFRNPVIQRFILRKDACLNSLAGISALSEYSLLSDNRYPTYAVTKKELKNCGLKTEQMAGFGEDAGCVVLELGYQIDFDGKGTQDPLSVVLSLTPEEREDERVSISVDEMLEEYVWSKG